MDGNYNYNNDNDNDNDNDGKTERAESRTVTRGFQALSNVV
jgi:hypothetical protein